VRRRIKLDLGQLAAGAAIGLAGPVLLYLTLLSLPASLAAGLGIPFFICATWLTRRLADLQRRRAATVLGAPVESPYAPPRKGLLARARALISDPATWRDLAWLQCQFVVGVASLVTGLGLWLAAAECLSAPLLNELLPAHTIFDTAALEITGRSTVLTWLIAPVGAALVVVAYRLPRHLVIAQARLAAVLLAPPATARLSAWAVRLAARVDRLTSTRDAALDASAAELRRVERDLHDGAQARFIAVTMSLGMAEDVIRTDPAVAEAMLADAKASAGAALSELRDLVRGIHPPVLADRGLAGAVQALALSSAVPTELDLRLDRRLAASLETTAYFVIAESLTNAIRHSGARRIQIAIADDGAALHITVRDDGHGGADPSQGTGLRGIERRLSAHDGTLRIASPPDGPTVLEMELPCGS
jgi:signal transduction histidine kinase